MAKRRRRKSKVRQKSTPPLSAALRPLSSSFDLERFNQVVITVGEMSYEIDWASATKTFEDDYETESMATIAVLSEVYMLRARANRDLKDLDRRKARIYGKQFSSSKKGGDGRRVTDKEAEADAKASPQYVALQEDVDEAEYAIDVLDALVAILRNKSELVRTLILKQPAI